MRFLVLAGLAALTGLVFCATSRTAGDPGRPTDANEVSVDRDLPMFLHIEDRKPVLSSHENLDEATAYNYLVSRAHDASAAAFARKARTDLRHYHLWDEPQKYRGEIVHVEGKLRQLWSYDAPKLAQNAGVQRLYEAWILDDRDKHNPWCLVFTDLPPGLREDGPFGQHVAFDGYFFKLYRYKDKRDDARQAPLLIGHAPEVEVAATADPDLSRYFSKTFLVCFLALISASVVVIVGLAWWFRRGDERVRRRLAQARIGEPEVLIPGEPSERGWKE